MNAPIRIGMIGLDTSHVPAFARVLHDASYIGHVPGAKVVAGYGGGSPDIELSHSRVAKFTEDLRKDYGAKIYDTVEEVAENSDIVFLESIDGRVHLPQLKKIAKFKRPVFVDKPLATNSADAKEQYRIAQENGFPLMSCSSLRYASRLTAALADNATGAIVGCDAFGPMAFLTEPPGYFWYGIHTAEVLFAVMGGGCKTVQVISNDDFDVVTGIWNDGRIGTMRGGRKGYGQFGVTIHREKGVQQADLTTNPDGRANYDFLVSAIMKTLPHGKSDVPKEQTLDIIRFLEAANESRASGKQVAV